MINRRYLDPLFFVFLMGLDAIIWLVTWVLHSTPNYVIIMVPTFAAMAVLGLVRALLYWNPRLFWGILGIASFVFLLFTMLTEALIAAVRASTLEFSASIGFMAMAVVSALLALFLAVVGAIPVSVRPRPAPTVGTQQTDKKKFGRKKTSGPDVTPTRDPSNGAVTSVNKDEEFGPAEKSPETTEGAR